MLSRRTAVLAGATGLVGSYLLKLLEQSSEFTEVHCLGRRRPPGDFQKMIYHPTDFSNLRALALPDKVDVLFCTLGTTIRKAGSQSEFYRVDHTYVLSLGKMALERHIPRMLVVTAMGADPSSFFFYNRVKGEVERDLQALKLPSLTIVRPALLTGERSEYRFAESLAVPVLNILNPLLQGYLKNYRSIPAESVAKAMLVLSLQEPAPAFHVVPSAELAALAEKFQ